MAQLYVVTGNGISFQVNAFSKTHAKYEFNKIMENMGYRRLNEDKIQVFELMMNAPRKDWQTC